VSRPTILTTSVLTTVGVAVLIGAGLIYLGVGVSYPLFHLVAEFFAIAVAVATFMIAWNSRRRAENGYLVFLGIAYLFVALLDLLHTVSFRGTSLLPGSSTNLATQLWIAARYIQASALLIAPTYIDKRISGRAVFWGYALATALLLGAIVVGVFPITYEEPGGLTTFKIASEFVVAALIAVGLGRLWRKRANVDPGVLRLMTASLGLLVVAEIAFSGYVDDPYNSANMFAHLLRILSYYLLYLALVRTSLERPAETLFRELSKTADALRASEMRYRSTFEQATLGIAHVSLDGRWLMSNGVMTQITGYETSELNRMRPEDLTYPDDRDTEERLRHKLVQGDINDYRLEKRIVRKDGSLLWVNSSTARLRGTGDDGDYLISILEDITDRKTAENERARSRELSEALNTIDRTVLASLDADTILQRVIEDASSVLKADASVVLDRTGPEAAVRRVHRMNPDLLGTAVPANPAGPSDKALKTGQPVWIARRADAVEMTRDWLKSQDFQSMLVVPLMFRDDEIGSVVFLYHHEPGHFGDAELAFAGKLSAIVSIAMENARLYGAEREIADVLQTSLIGTPQAVPGLDIAQAYYSATELTKIGGDFYDVFEVAPGRIAFVLGDVAGKGLEAATITAMAKSTLRAFAYRDPDPAAVLGAANAAIAEQIGDSSFITAVFGMIETDSGATTLACAGHPSPIRCGEPACAEEPIVRNLPLGVFDDTEFETYETQMKPGDVMVLFSDGLIDARHGSDLLGEDRVREMLVGMGFDATPRTVVARLLDAAREHSGGNPPDDITILAIRYLGPPEEEEQRA
jgi:PAS domain S-box-containing protein